MYIYIYIYCVDFPNYILSDFSSKLISHYIASSRSRNDYFPRERLFLIIAHYITPAGE